MYPANENSNIPITTNKSTSIKTPQNNIILLSGAENRSLLKFLKEGVLSIVKCHAINLLAAISSRMDDRKNGLI